MLAKPFIFFSFVLGVRLHVHPGERHVHPGERHVHPGERHVHPWERHVHPGERHLHPGEPHLFGAIGQSARIPCLLPEKNPDGGHNVLWYRRGTEEPLAFVKNCEYNNRDYKYVCQSDRRSTTLEIRHARPNDSGVYHCALMGLTELRFSSGSALTVGDSYTANTSVLLVIPSAQQNVPERSVPLACVVRAVSGQVWFSWNISGVPDQGQVSSVRDGDGSWTFINHIRIAPDIWTRGGVSCEVQFNSSHSGVKRTARYKDAPPGGLGWCATATPYAIRALLLLCTVLFTIHRALQRTAAGNRHTPDMARATNSAVSEGGQLDFEMETPKRKRAGRPKEGRKK